MEQFNRDISQLLRAMHEESSPDRELLWQLVYEELRRMASRRMISERQGLTLSTTGLVHEVYIKMMGSSKQAVNRDHFYALAANAMRQILIDYARKSNAQKRINKQNLTSLDEVEHVPGNKAGRTYQNLDLIDLNNALEELRELNARWAKVVEYRYFGGMTFKEIAVLIDRDQRTAERDWERARSWLYSRLTDPESLKTTLSLN
ncbi:MAG: sigma-70 family RNA polymerase sigma factor [Rhodothermaceae bacterium]|nr:sigma-70 family RNA polymerase sigma factor [Rhodothermaceae bacterium]